MMSNTIESPDTIASHPGVYMEEIIDEMSSSRATFAQQLGTSLVQLERIISGQATITSINVDELARLTGVSAVTWLNLQEQYEHQLAKMRE